MDDKTSALTARNFPSAHDEARQPATDRRYVGPGEQLPPAFTDTDFLPRVRVRPVRRSSNCFRPELVQQELGIRLTIADLRQRSHPDPCGSRGRGVGTGTRRH
ncbi:MAG: hypothetical protein IPH51_12685 [Rubrivivax sp.]|nr:hypothetical protein [Rubrivivax sp.]